MMKLLKYELLRRKSLLIGAAVSMLFVEGVVFFGIYRGGNWNTLALVMTILLAVGGLLLPILDTVTKLYSDYKQKQGYMLFLTPQSGYRILWSKAIFGALEIVAAIALVGGCMLLSGAALDRFQQGAATGLLLTIQKEVGSVSVGGMLFVYTGLVALQMMAQMAIAMLAVTVGRVLVQGSGYNWLVALAMYFALAIAVNVVDSLLMVAFGLIGDMTQLMDNAASAGRIVAKYFAVGAGTYVVWFALCTALSGRLANRNVDL